MFKLIVNANPPQEEQGRAKSMPVAELVDTEAVTASLRLSDHVFQGDYAGGSSACSQPGPHDDRATSKRLSYGEALAWVVEKDQDVRSVKSSEAAVGLSTVRLVAGLFERPLDEVATDVWLAAASYELFLHIGRPDVASQFLANGCRAAGPLLAEIYACQD